MPSYDVEDHYPIVEWAADRGVVADPTCVQCWGEGTTDDDATCPCLAAALTAAFPEAAADAEPAMYCRRCDGDGEDIDGETCLCMIEDLRRRQELIESRADGDTT